jgi:spore coat protein U-like protein
MINHFKITVISLIGLLLGLFSCQSSFSSIATDILPVTTLVSANCSMNSAVLNFGDYNPIGTNQHAPLDAMTTFVIMCTKGANVTVRLNNGLYAGNANQTTKAMSDGSGNYISYELYNNSGHSTVWNEVNPVTFISTSSSARNQAVYGRVPGGQNVAAGIYHDTVTITATF